MNTQEREQRLAYALYKADWISAHGCMRSWDELTEEGQSKYLGYAHVAFDHYHGIQNEQAQRFAASILQVAHVVIDQIEKLDTAEDPPPDASSMLVNSIMTCFQGIVNACHMQFPMQFEVSDEQRERLKARLEEMEQASE